MAVPVTDLEKQSPLFKYYERDIARPLKELQDTVAASRIAPENALRPENMDLLFDEGYLPAEFGYCQFNDGTAMIANLIKMPKVTVEMFDWWFAWHVLEPLRYKIWDKNNHIYCLTKNPERICDKSLSMRERYWDTACDICETHIPGENPGRVIIHFRNPADIGFSAEKLKAFNGTIVCSGDECAPVIMVHFVRPVDDGIELRTRFWYGYCVIGGKPVKSKMPEGLLFSENRLKNSLVHGIK
jgi:hypothetical protein